MEWVSAEELVALHLAEYVPGELTDSHAFERSTLGIAEALDLEDTLSARIELLTTLTSMREAGLLHEESGEVAGLSGERNLYSLTDAGKEIARRSHEQLEEEKITVVDNGNRVELGAEAIESELPELTLTQALSRVNEDGVLHRRELPDSGMELIGRSGEVDVLVDLATEVQSGTSQAVLIAGESGIGKTALVERSLEDIEDAGFEIVSGVAREEATEPYLPVREALAEHQEFVPDRLSERSDDVDAGDIGELGSRRETLFYDIGDGLAELARTRPLAVFLDDLHLADPGTIALLEHLLETLETPPILLVLAYRPEELENDHPLFEIENTHANVVPLELEALDRGSTRTLIEQTLGDLAVPESFVDTIYERTAGHPLFVEATVSQLHDRGVVNPRMGHYPDDLDAPLPEEIRTAVERRLETLDETARTVLNVGSVIGSSVDFLTLSMIVDLPEADLREYVDLLVSARIWRRDADTDRFEFVNEIVRDAVQEQLPDHTRRRLHSEVAAALDTVHQSDLAAHSGLIAYHHASAGEPEQAVEYYHGAGAYSASIYAHETAIDNYDRALELAREHDLDAMVDTLLKQMGEVYLHIDSYEKADRYFEHVAERTGDLTTYWEIAGHRALIRNRLGEYEAAIEVAEDGLDSWDGERATSGVRNLLTRKTWALFWINDMTEAKRHGQTQLEVAEHLDDPAAIGDALNVLARIEQADGNHERATDLLEAAVEAAQSAGARRHEAFIRVNLGLVHVQRDTETALEIFQDCLRQHEETDSPWGEMSTLSYIGDCLEHLGEWPPAMDRYEEALDLATRLGAEQFIAGNTIRIGRLTFKRGDLEQAREQLDRGVSLAEEGEFRGFIEEGLVASARLALYCGEFEIGVERAERVIQAATPTRLEMGVEAYAVKGRLRLAQDDVEGAIAAFAAGKERATTLSNPVGLVCNLAGLADAHLKMGDSDTATRHAEKGREVAAELRDPLLDIRSAISLAATRQPSAPTEATDILHDARETARELGASVHECEVSYHLGRIHQTTGDWQAAKEVLEDAHALAGQTGARYFAGRSERALEEPRVDGLS